MTNRLTSWPEFYFHCKSCAGRGMEGEITEEAIYDAAEQIAAIARDTSSRSTTGFPNGA